MYLACLGHSDRGELDGAQRGSAAVRAARGHSRRADRLDTAGCARLSPAIPTPHSPLTLPTAIRHTKKSHQKETFPCQ